MNTAAETASDLRQELGQDAADLTNTLKGRVKQEAETGKNKALEIAGSATSALGVAADQLRDNPDAPDWMASGLQKIARQIEQAASDLDGRSLDDLGRDASRLARDNPATFLAVSAATGFFAARLLRVGADKKRHAQAGSDPSQLGAMQAASNTDSDAPVWPADENVLPTNDGGTDFAPAYGVEEGTIR